MKSILGDKHGRIMRELWSEKLPQTLTDLLIYFSGKKSLSGLVEVADKIAVNYHQNHMVSFIKEKKNDEINELKTTLIFNC